MKGKILELLRKAGDSYISGEEIAQGLGVSRTAVWKHIQALKEDGYDIVSHSHSGYSLKESPDLLLSEEIKPLLHTKIIGKKIVHFDKVSSSNDEAKKLALQGAPDGTVIVAEEQTGGKGRLSRGWFSPKYKGIWFSMLLRPTFLPQEAPKCTLMTAVALTRAIRKFGVDVGIKWPNDILYNGKKLDGTLTEMNAEMERIHYVIIGTGLNVNILPEDFPEELRDIGISLQSIKGERLARVPLFAEILNAMDELYCEVLEHGFSKVLDEWRKYSVTLGREINVIGVKETYAGVAADIDEDGALLVDTPKGRTRVLAGDVSIRPRNK